MLGVQHEHVDGGNKQLHHTERIKDMEDRKEIIEAIKKEYKVGLSRLPAYVFSLMFKKKQEELIKESMNR